MGTRRLAGVVVALALGACRFHIEPIDVPVGPPGVDLAGDGSRGDMLHDVFAPAHVGPVHVQEGASSLVGATDIDTEMLLIDGGPPPAGVLFLPEATHDEWAVLSVRDFEVPTTLRVHGRRALIVVAVGTARIAGTIRANADGRTPGPGGQFTGPGRGGDGKSVGMLDSGGGGGGHGLPGALGGRTNDISSDDGGASGPIYTGELEGGSGGGDGAGLAGGAACMDPGGDFSKGGAGGGAIQISSELAIELGPTGIIDAGGGGGRGGCQTPATAGGGGGSGGTVWLEAPKMQLLGKVAANGGGGGSGGTNVITFGVGKPGENGRTDGAVAAGGVGGGGVSGAGGKGGIYGTDPKRGESNANAGGGGGGVGRIRLRTKAAAPITGASTLVSPMPQLTTDF